MDSKGFIALVQDRLSVLPEVSEYTHEYVQRLLHELPYRTMIYRSIFEEVFKHIKLQRTELTVVDYGGGTGLLSCYAKWIGIGNVIYMDIFEQSCHDAQKIADKLGLRADSYVQGDINALNTHIDALVSTDVIEHIYDLTGFFQSCYQLNQNLVQVHVTGANPYNSIIRKRLMALQIRNENEFHAPPKGAKQMDDYRAYKNIRKIYIQERFGTQLTENEINELVSLTRGRNFDDLQTLLETYLQTKIYPQSISHPTNTCDPNTGNWSERLITQEEMDAFSVKSAWASNYESLGFNTRQPNWLKNFIWSMLNIIGRLMGQNSKRLLPLLKITIKTKTA
ncbi:MAG: class I SAM-dependent methyltransferase [Bacteroidetes bacterium]|nr:class I SAM-dependent methyltransferase [Bacteroidota bacterium]